VIGLSVNAIGSKLNSIIEFTNEMKLLLGNSEIVGHSLGRASVHLL